MEVLTERLRLVYMDMYIVCLCVICMFYAYVLALFIFRRDTIFDDILLHNRVHLHVHVYNLVGIAIAAHKYFCDLQEKSFVLCTLFVLVHCTLGTSIPPETMQYAKLFS